MNNLEVKDSPDNGRIKSGELLRKMIDINDQYDLIVNNNKSHNINPKINEEQSSFIFHENQEKKRNSRMIYLKSNSKNEQQNESEKTEIKTYTKQLSI